MTSQLNKKLITVEEYHRMGEVGILSDQEKVELIHGEILYMSPIGSRHSAVVDRISNYLIRHLPDQTIVRVQGPVRLNKHSEPEPDILLLKPVKDFYAPNHPLASDVLLLIEVADSSLSYDRDFKLPLYANSQIEEYWIVDLAANQVEVYRSPANSIYKNRKILTPEDGIAPLAFPEHTIEVRNLIGDYL